MKSIDFESPAAFWGSFIVFVMGVCSDTISTSELITNSELTEINPAVVYIVSEFGTVGFFVFKIIMFGVIYSTLLWHLKNWRQSASISFLITGIVWSLAGLWNLYLVL